ncbi:MAG: hypothetical protein QOG04_166 [Actinomycetota bacterium]|jgi:hypothetical protein|nr:hypothetical protein [Actinomycetota bacterium]
MLDSALGKTFASLSTLVLVACVLTLPIHVAHAFVFRNVLAVQEIGPEIQAFPEGRQVRGVAKGDFDAERNWLLILLGGELALLPFVYRASRRVITVENEGGVATVRDAWTHLGSQHGGFILGPVLIGAAIGAVCGWLVWTIGKVIADMASADLTWAVVGLSRAAAVALVFAFVTGVTASLPARGAPQPQPVEDLNLY